MAVVEAGRGAAEFFAARAGKIPEKQLRLVFDRKGQNPGANGRARGKRRRRQRQVA